MLASLIGIDIVSECASVCDFDDTGEVFPEVPFDLKTRPGDYVYK